MDENGFSQDNKKEFESLTSLLSPVTGRTIRKSASVEASVPAPSAPEHARPCSSSNQELVYVETTTAKPVF
jgi:hypothetical protein